MDRVAIILVNYNGYDDTVECVKSLSEISYPNYEIIVVDNCSNEEQRRKLCEDDTIAQKCKIILSESNEGFSAGNNLGIKQALADGCEYVLLLNNDTIVHKEFLTELMLEIKSGLKVGISTGNIYYYYNPQKLWYSAGEYNIETGSIQMVKKNDNSSKKEVSFACGCLMLIKSELLREIGLLDESFFLYTEDTDFCCRTLQAGWKIIWTSNSIIYHKVSASSGDISAFQQYYQIRNDLIVAKKYVKHFKKYFINRFIIAIATNIKFKGSIKSVLLAYIHYLRKITGKVELNNW